jgi:ATP/ADP translocase
MSILVLYTIIVLILITPIWIWAVKKFKRDLRDDAVSEMEKRQEEKENGSQNNDL